jgi:coatomer subunit beta'
MDSDYKLLRVLDDHEHYVMMMAFNPRDFNTFASASLDRTLKVDLKN